MLKDKQNFLIWIDSCHGALFKHAFWMTGNRVLAEDLVQETFYQAWKNRHSIENSDNVLPWLLTVLRRAVYKEYQHSRSEPVSLSEEHIDDRTDLSQDHLDNLMDLSNGLMSLSARQRELLLLHALHGFSYEQISEQLSIPIGTVMSRIARARQTLRAFFTKDDADKVIIPFKKEKVR
jgi:RNA polymerase sigma-70 factor (ECF subfamily)